MFNSWTVQVKHYLSTFRTSFFLSPPPRAVTKPLSGVHVGSSPFSYWDVCGLTGVLSQGGSGCCVPTRGAWGKPAYHHRGEAPQKLCGGWGGCSRGAGVQRQPQGTWLGRMDSFLLAFLTLSDLMDNVNWSYADFSVSKSPITQVLLGVRKWCCFDSDKKEVLCWAAPAMSCMFKHWNFLFLEIRSVWFFFPLSLRYFTADTEEEM